MDTARVMRIFGYPKDQEHDLPLEMEEVTIAAEPRTLRQPAAFLSDAADQMEQNGDRFGHEHYSDFTNDKGSSPSSPPDIVVIR